MQDRKSTNPQAKPLPSCGVEREQKPNRAYLHDSERRKAGADTEPVGAGEAFAELRSGVRIETESCMPARFGEEDRGRGYGAGGRRHSRRPAAEWSKPGLTTQKPPAIWREAAVAFVGFKPMVQAET